MLVICCAVCACYLVLWILAGLERKRCGSRHEGAFHMMQPFEWIAEWYLHKKQKSVFMPLGRGRGYISRRVVEDLQKLHSGILDEKQQEAYYVGKLSLVLAIVFAGTLFCTVISLQAESGGRLSEGQRIVRGDYREDAVTVELQPTLDGQALERILLEVNGRIPEEEEVDALEALFWQELCEAALGENASAGEVRSDLNLLSGLEGYPFTVKWESPDLLLITENGVIRQLAEKEEAIAAELSAKVTYDNREWNHSWQVTICPPVAAEEEVLRRELEAYLIQQEAQSRESLYLELPDSWQDAELQWTEQLEDNGLLFWLLTMAAAAVIFRMKDQDLHAQVMKRQEVIKKSYASVSNKLLLYLGAGLTVRSAFERMGQEYVQEKQEGGGIEAVYEEILHTCRELRTGTSEAEAYEHFGRRCGTQEYVRMGAMLSRNLKKGSSTLIARLKEEGDNAVREKWNRSRQLGEEASTKLLMPMMLMLGIVMVMIMVPAFGAM